MAASLPELTSMSLPKVRSYFRETLQRNGTNVEENDADPLGDGDQSRIGARHNQQFYRDFFAAGGDINHFADLGMAPLSDFAKYCVSGAVDQVQRALESAAANNQGEDGNETSMAGGISTALTRLLEKRETSLRLSPLLMIVSMGKNLAVPNMADRQVQVAKLLLKYGARPDARDVCGKTVFHYGMGAMASSMTIQVARLCLQAHSSSHLHGKMVELHGLQSSPALNGSQGICKGYLTDTGRRPVYLLEGNTTLALKPENLKLIKSEQDSEEGSNVVATNTAQLCDIPDRLGAVCLLEVIYSDRTDVAKILLKEYRAGLDIEDCDGVSPKSMSLGMGALKEAAVMVNKAAGKETIKAQDAEEHMCSNCGKQVTPPFRSCSGCKSVQYCGKVCQVEHWKAGGHKKVCKSMAAKKIVAVVLERPIGTSCMGNINLTSKTGKKKSSSPRLETDGFQKPSKVAVDEKFYIKVQGNGPTDPLCIYDESREFDFMLFPGKRGFDELLKAVQAEPTWEGRKTFVTASFDAEGGCTVYPGLTSIKKW